MAAEILLEINGHKYNASGFSYDFYQIPDFKGKSVTGIKGGDIHVVLDSSYDNSILETMLSDKTRKVPCVPWEEYEPCPVSGRIQFVQDDYMYSVNLHLRKPILPVIRKRWMPTVIL